MPTTPLADLPDVDASNTFTVKQMANGGFIIAVQGGRRDFTDTAVASYESIVPLALDLIGLFDPDELDAAFGAPQEQFIGDRVVNAWGANLDARTVGEARMTAEEKRETDEAITETINTLMKDGRVVPDQPALHVDTSDATPPVYPTYGRETDLAKLNIASNKALLKQTALQSGAGEGWSAGDTNTAPEDDGA